MAVGGCGGGLMDRTQQLSSLLCADCCLWAFHIAPQIKNEKNEKNEIRAYEKNIQIPQIQTRAIVSVRIHFMSPCEKGSVVSHPEAKCFHPITQLPFST